MKTRLAVPADDNRSPINVSMNPPRLLSSVLLLIASAIGRDFGLGERAGTKQEYLFVAGPVDDATSESDGYFVTMVLRPDKTPWLVVAAPLEREQPGFSTHASSSSDKVSINGIEYSPIPGRTIVAFHSDNQKTRSELATAENRTLQSLQEGLITVTASQIEQLLKLPDDDGP